jgi:hypothetical protein
MWYITKNRTASNGCAEDLKGGIDNPECNKNKCSYYSPGDMFPMNHKLPTRVSSWDQLEL